MPLRNWASPTASSVSWLYTQPVGLFGEVMTMAFVRSVSALPMSVGLI